jgi:hypothetical protein
MRFVVRRTRVLHIFESTSCEVEAESAEQAISEAIEEGGDNWLEDDREEWASSAEAKPIVEAGPVPKADGGEDDFLEARYDDQFGAGEDGP